MADDFDKLLASANRALEMDQPRPAMVKTKKPSAPASNDLDSLISQSSESIGGPEMVMQPLAKLAPDHQSATLQDLITQSGQSLAGSGESPQRPRSGKDKKPKTASKPDDLETIAQAASASLSSGQHAERQIGSRRKNSSRPPVGIAQAVASAGNMPTKAGKAEPIPGAAPLPQKRSRAAMSISIRWWMPAIIVVAVGAVFLSDRGAKQPPPLTQKATRPLAQKMPKFELTPQQQELAPWLIEARNEVESYRASNGKLPEKIETQPSGGKIMISTKLGKRYALIGIVGEKTLVLTADGQWYQLGG